MATPLRLLRGQAGTLRLRPPWLARGLSAAHDAEAPASSSSQPRDLSGDGAVQRRAAAAFPAEAASSAFDMAAYLQEASAQGRTRTDDAVGLHELDAVVARAAKKSTRRRRSAPHDPTNGGDEELARLAVVWKNAWRAVDAAFTLKQLRQLAVLAGIKGAKSSAKEKVLRQVLLQYVKLQDPVVSSLPRSKAQPASKAAAEQYRLTVPMRRSEAWLFATQVPFANVRKQLRLGAADAQVLRAEMGFEILLKAGGDEQLVRLREWLEEWKSTITRTTIPLSALFGPDAPRPDSVPVRVLRDICSASDCFLTNVTLESEPDVSGGTSHEASVRIDALAPSSQQRALSLLRAWAHEEAVERPLLAYEPSSAEQELALPLHEPTYAFVPHAAVQPVPPLSRRDGLTWRMARQYKAWELGSAAPPRQLRKVEEEAALEEAWNQLDAAEGLDAAVRTREVHFGHLLYSSDYSASLLQPPLPGQWALSKALGELANGEQAAAPIFHPAQPPVVLSLARSAHVPALDPNLGLGVRKAAHRSQLARLTYRAEDGKLLVVDVEQPEPGAFEKPGDAAGSRLEARSSQHEGIATHGETSSAPASDTDKADPLDELASALESMLRDNPLPEANSADDAASDGTEPEAVQLKRPPHADLLQMSWRSAREADVLVPDSPVDMRLVSCAAVPLPAEEEIDVAEALGDFVSEWSQLVKRFDKNAASKARSQHTAPPVPLSHEANPVVPSTLVLSGGRVLQLQSAASLSRLELVFSAATLCIDGVMQDGDTAPRAEASLVLPPECAWEETSRLVADILDGQYRTLRAR